MNLHVYFRTSLSYFQVSTSRIFFEIFRFLRKLSQFYCICFVTISGLTVPIIVASRKISVREFPGISVIFSFGKSREMVVEKCVKLGADARLRCASWHLCCSMPLAPVSRNEAAAYQTRRPRFIQFGA